MALKLGRPGSGTGGKWAKEEHVDHLHGFVRISDKPAQQTSFGESDAVLCEYVVCFDDDFVASDVLIFGTAIVPALIDGMENDVVVARLGQGQAKPGRKAPWLLFDPTDEDLARASEWLDKYSGEINGVLHIEPPVPPLADEPF